MMRTLFLIIILVVVDTSSSFSWNSYHPKTQQQELHAARRAFLQSATILIAPTTAAAAAATTTTTWLTFPTEITAQGMGEGEQRMRLNQKPKAPMGALIPAAQQRLLLEQCLAILSSSKLLSLWKEKQQQQDEYIQQLQSILLPLEEEPNNKLRRSSSSSSNNNNNKDLSVMLQYQPNKNLSGSLVRAAMNVYTANLNYGGDEAQYTVTDPDWKKSYIRANYGLPDVKQVIEADLNLRDLYRKQVQLKLDDASAELYSKNRNDEELKNLLQEAADMFDRWLGMVGDADVKVALQEALEGKSLKVYDSYYAGFVPLR